MIRQGAVAAALAAMLMAPVAMAADAPAPEAPVDEGPKGEIVDIPQIYVPFTKPGQPRNFQVIEFKIELKPDLDSDRRKELLDKVPHLRDALVVDVMKNPTPVNEKNGKPDFAGLAQRLKLVVIRTWPKSIHRVQVVESKPKDPTEGKPKPKAQKKPDLTKATKKDDKKPAAPEAAH